MEEGQNHFVDLMEGVRQGRDDAARELLRRYSPHIFRVVRRRLPRKLRSKFDSSDFVQAVWATFFCRGTADRSFDQPQALVAFLVTVAQSKVVDALRQRLHARKYDVNREHSLERSTPLGGGNLVGVCDSPSERVSADEEWNQLLRALPGQYQQLLEMLRDGRTHREVAEALGINEKTIRRVIERLKQMRHPA